MTITSEGKKIFALLFAINLFNYIDRQILYSVFPLIKIDLSLSDTQLGALASAFMIIYTLYAPFAGYFGDRQKRPLWLCVSAVLWSAATMFSGLAKSYLGLLSARAAVGVGEAGYMSIAPPYLSEHFPKERRARVLSFFAIALPLGSALGYLLGGVLGENFGWRAAFFIVGVPGFLLGLMALTLKDERPALSTSQARPPSLKDYSVLLKNKTYLLVSLSQAAVTFAMGGLAAWMPTYFNRYFDFSVGKAGMVFGAITVVAGTLGTFLGGFWADRLLKKTSRAYYIVSYISFFAAVPFAFAAVFANSPQMAIALFFTAILLAFIYAGPLSAAVLTCTAPSMHSMAFAANIFIIHAFGDAVSPTIIGMISDASGLRLAVAACVIFIALAGFLSLLAAKTIRQSQPEKL
ncbi:MAG: MFS transporter [Elusimicrobia bacterium]|nr:MFS transporter [Elusimicrobiota bacterium]